MAQAILGADQHIRLVEGLAEHRVLGCCIIRVDKGRGKDILALPFRRRIAKDPFQRGALIEHRAIGGEDCDDIGGVLHEQTEAFFPVREAFYGLLAFRHVVDIDHDGLHRGITE